MQIKRLHKNIYKLYAYSRTQECLEAYRLEHKDPVEKWDKLKNQGVDYKIIQDAPVLK